MTFSRIHFAFALGSTLAAQPHIAAACGDGGLSSPVQFAARPYSDAGMRDALAALPGCSNHYRDQDCEPYAVIESWGAKAVPRLLAAVKNGADRTAYLALIERADVPGSGLALLAIARSMKPDGIQSWIYRSAVEIDRELAFDSLAAEAETAGDAWTMQLVADGMRVMPERALAWVSRELPVTARPIEVAQLAAHLVNSETAPAILRLASRTTDPRAKLHLVGAAADYNASDDSTWTIFRAGLTSRDGAIRDLARELFSPSFVPRQLGPTFLPIVEAEMAGRALDRDDARKLAQLGSTREDVYDLLFEGLDSESRSARFMSVMSMEKMAEYVPASLRAKYIGLVSRAIASSNDERWIARADKAIAALRARS
jgi:hypothetical protein